MEGAVNHRRHDPGAAVRPGAGPGERPVATIILLIPFLTEILSGNMTMSEVFTPVSLVMLLIAYGLAAVLIRELALRWQLGVEGLFVLGLAYGIYNEGLCAKTLLINNAAVVTDSFARYSLIGGVNAVWAGFILVWHSCHSVVYPILIILYLCPGSARRPWIGRARAVAFAALVVAVGTGAFVYNPSAKAGAGHYIFFVGAMGVLAAVSRLMPKTYPAATGGHAGFKPVLLGMSLFGYTLGMFVLGNIRAPLAAHGLFSVLCLGLCWTFVRRQGWVSLRTLVLIALGNYLSDSIFLTLGGIAHHSNQRTAAGLMLIAALGLSVWRIIAGRNNAQDTGAAVMREGR